KNAEDRYQSALGIKFDLENCLTQLQETGKIESFQIAQWDVCDRFLIAEKLYGRETEVQTLLAAFDRVSLGDTELMLVGGFSGIGKTAVINEVHKPIVRQRGYFIKGKYDQFGRNIPFSAFVQAFRDLMGQLLCESNAQLQAWKTRILSALGDSGQVLIDVIPELEKIIGTQPPATELSVNAAQHRFNLLMQKFIQVFTTEKHPLVIFLDDLQWADSASLKLLQLLMEDTGHLLILGAYRDNEVSPAHPFILTVDEIVKTGAKVNTISLQPLSLADMNQLVSDALNCVSDTAAQPLTELVYQKTQGNPFFATQFLKALHEDRHITFNWEARHWQCDIAQVRALAITDNVVEFMALQLQKLSAQTQNILKLAACIGAQFDLHTLAIASEQSLEDVATALWRGLQEGLIIPTTEIYKFFTQSDTVSVDREAANPTYRFLHDRVQQAAYSLIPEEQKQVTHLKIGQLILQNTSVIEHEEKLFVIVGHLNLGQELISQPSDRLALAQLNLKAGLKARNSTAYAAARVYLQAGIQLLETNCWQEAYKLTLNLYTMAAEVAYLNGDFEGMEQLAALVLQQAQTIFDKVKIYEIQIGAQTLQSNVLEAIAVGRNAIRQLGVELPKEPDEAEISKALQTLATQLENIQIEELLDLPVTTDATTQAAMQLLGMLFSPIIQGMPSLLPLLSSTMVTLSLQSGNTGASTIGYAIHGMVMSAFLEDAVSGYAFGKLALNLLEKFDIQEIKCVVMFLFGCFIQHHQERLNVTILTLKAAYHAGIETGNFVHAGYSLATHSNARFFSGGELDSFVQDMADYSLALAQVKQYSAQVYVDMARQVTINLIEPVSQPYHLIGNVYDETVMLPKHQQDNDLTAIAEAYIYKLLLAYCFGNYTDALTYIPQAKLHLIALSGTIYVPIFHFYAALTHLAIFPTQPQEQAEILAVVQTHQTTLHKWAQNAPMNHLHKWYLVEAEHHRVLGEKILAIECYDKAISLAKKNEFINEEALSNELTAKFYLDWGKETIAQAYMHQAYYCYARWGAKAKVDNLEKRYPHLLQSILQQQRINLKHDETISFLGNFSSTRTSTTDSTGISDALDFTSVLKAAQAISTSLELDTLITTLTQIILENSGAKKCILLLPKEDIWQVQAITFIADEKIQTILEVQPLDNCQFIPVKLINYVKNTQKTVVIDNCQTDIPGVIGKYMLEHRPQSVLCTPIINQGHLVGILYLENNLTQGVFTSERLSVINLLSSQAAISLENAQLYTNLQSTEARFHHLAENLPGMIYQFQLLPDGIAKFSYVSTGCYEIYEVSSEQAVADASSLISLAHPEDMARFQESITISAQTLEPWLYQGRIITLSGQLKWIQAASRPIKQADGSIIWDGLLLDVTERKQAEAAVIEKSQELKKALEDLQQAQLQMIQSEKMSALGNLVAGVAHEMNNPLGFIYASLQQAKPTIADIVEHLKLYQKTVPHPTDKIKDHAEEIDLDYSIEDLSKIIDSMVMACDRLKNISTSLRTFSRADKDYKMPFNIYEGIDSTILILKHRLKANDQRPAIEVKSEYNTLPLVECFPGQLNQVFMNILANAIDALDESNIGRSFTEIKANPNWIKITTSLENNSVKIAIADNGKGISEEVKQKIFNRLFTTKGVGKGTGLGLAIARQIVEETHGGKLSFNSVLGQGTEFVIEIPV
ncbi:MAG: AAA family ATPase, partial [Nostoc sp. DedVER02]